MITIVVRKLQEKFIFVETAENVAYISHMLSFKPS